MEERHHGIDTADGELLRARLSVAARSPGITALSHHSAAHLHGLVARPPHLIHVLALRGSHPCRRPDVIVHHTRAIDPLAIVHIAGMPVTDVPSTVVMMAAYATLEETKAMIRAATSMSLSLERLRAVAEARRRRGRAGPSQLLGVLDSPDIAVHVAAAEAPGGAGYELPAQKRDFTSVSQGAWRPRPRTMKMGVGARLLGANVGNSVVP